ncbi:MAG: DNA gyrase subunit A [Erysipelotrichaceae bacterium]|nr:DNA gyrase subunit A [Erysipelotrichaceae bacterium]
MDEFEEKEFNHGKISQTNVASEVRKSFLEYAMSVIVARALPDVRDGLKPVQRRILYAMNDLGMYSSQPHRKSARIVGDVIGKYHPHGDTAVYEAMVRMAQDFSYRYPLVDGHGNFGSMDGDPAAAMRYTEARMSKISMELLKDLKMDTVNMIPNYDGEDLEPEVLPSRFPNILVNGAMGIAVGMATNIPTHNLREAIDATIAIMENPDITTTELMNNYIPGPDFPTGGSIIGRSGIKQAYDTGRGTIVLRSKSTVEEMANGKSRIIITEIPYQVNKAQMVEKIGDLVRDKQIEGITDLRDESNMNGVRIVMELRKDVQPEVIMNQLYRLTSLQSTFGVNMLVLDHNVPKLMGLKEVLNKYAEHQIEVTIRRTRFLLKKAEERAHILEGYRIALDHIDEIIHIIRNSKDDPEAIATMNERFGLSDIQGKAILDMQLRRLTGLQRDKIEEEYNNLVAQIADYHDILANYSRVVEIVKTELTELRDKYGDDRRTDIIEDELNVEDEDLIPQEDILVTMTANGYIKRIPSDTYRTQNRGGKGVKGMSVNSEDVVEQLIKMHSHDFVCFFTNYGKVYRIKAYKIPNSSRTGKGIPVVNLLNLDKNEKVKAIINYSKDEMENGDGEYLIFATKKGLVKRVDIREFDSIRQSGKIAISLREDDELIAVKKTNGNNEIIIGGSNGKAVRFNENTVRPMGRNASGVKGLEVDGCDVIGMTTDTEGDMILSVSEKGYGKKTALEEYRLTQRGAKGVKTINITEKNGPLVSIKAVNGDEDLMVITNEGVVIRISLETVGTYGRTTQGVKIINLNENQTVAAVAVVDKLAEEEGEDE